MTLHWDESADVVVVGYGCAGAITAVAATEAGANVLLLEKQPEASHCSSSAMSGGHLMLPLNKNAIKHLEALYKIPSGQSWVDKDMIRVYVESAMQLKLWIEQHGGHIQEVDAGAEHHEIEGYDAFFRYRFAGMGYALQRFLSDKLKEKKIAIKYDAPAKRLVTDASGRVEGVEVESKGKTVKIGAAKGVVLASGGFEFNETMKLNYLPVHPTYFTGSPSQTGDGIRMAAAIGADLWHMNCLSARLVGKFPGFPISFNVSMDGTRVKGSPTPAAAGEKRPGYIIVDRDGRRFTNENFKAHAVYYELTYFDTQRMLYPRVPCWTILDQRRMDMGSMVGRAAGASGPFGLYEWSKDNSKELKNGWIITAPTLRELAGKIGVPADNLEKTVAIYNKYCASGKDADFKRESESLVSLEHAPYYAVNLWPGGPNTQGGPKRNAKGHVLNVDGNPIPGLYSAGEMGSMFGMLYPGGGSNLAECMAMGRVTGEHVAAEKRK